MKKRKNILGSFVRRKQELCHKFPKEAAMRRET